MLINQSIDNHIRTALAEDISSEDISTNAVVDANARATADLICKEDGVLAGLDVFARVFALLDANFTMESGSADGERVTKGATIAVLHANARALLSGERTALNYLQRMSGIATYTASVVAELAGSKARLVDTRKTTPGFRIFEKYAVRVGGAGNHRFNLSDGVLLKDNHIGAAGSITAAIHAARAYAPFVHKVEIEVETINGLREALDAGADIIMLDNMDAATMREAVRITAGRVPLECSGNVTRENIRALADTGVDYISSGALTHSAPVLDLSLKRLRRE
jgi:nicotinate-nucleotide pyrophosphorylase (carboxylating)